VAQRGHEPPCQQKRRQVVDGKAQFIAILALLASASSWQGGANAGIVEQHVDAFLLASQPFGQHSHLRKLGKVRAIPLQAGVARLCANLLQRALPPGFIAPMQQERGPGARKMQGNRFTQSISRSGNQDDLFCQWSHMVLPVSRITLQSEAKLGQPPLISCPGFHTVRSVPGPSSRPPAACLAPGRRRAVESAAHSLALLPLFPPYGSASA
jgi:hypothetical protein